MNHSLQKYLTVGFTFWVVFALATCGYLYRYGKKDIRDENLKDAIELINYIRKKYDFENDINWKNIMVRRTNLGYQLVITDPLS